MNLTGIGEVTEVRFCSSDIGGVSFMGSSKTAEMLTGHACLESPAFGSDAFQADAVFLPSARIAPVVAQCCLAEVVPAVIAGVVVTMVEEDLWLLSSDHFPDDSVCNVRRAVDDYVDAFFVLGPSYVASFSHSATSDFPSENASGGIVAKQFEEALLGWEGNPHV